MRLLRDIDLTTVSYLCQQTFTKKMGRFKQVCRRQPSEGVLKKATFPAPKRKISQVPAPLPPKETEEYFTGGMTKCDLCQVELTRRNPQRHARCINQRKLMFAWWLAVKKRERFVVPPTTDASILNRHRIDKCDAREEEKGRRCLTSLPALCINHHSIGAES